MAAPFLTLALDGGEWSASHLCHFMPQETSPGILIRYKKLGGPQSQSGCYREGENLLSLLGIELQFLGHPCVNVNIPTSHLVLLGK
jgi:hypothetical protein